jgi:hypothetical protein
MGVWTLSRSSRGVTILERPKKTRVRVRVRRGVADVALELDEEGEKRMTDGLRAEAQKNIEVAEETEAERPRKEQQAALTEIVEYQGIRIP